MMDWLMQPVSLWVFLAFVAFYEGRDIFRRRRRQHLKSSDGVFGLGLARRLDQIEDDVQNLSVAARMASGRRVSAGHER